MSLGSDSPGGSSDLSDQGDTGVGGFDGGSDGGNFWGDYFADAPQSPYDPSDGGVQTGDFGSIDADYNSPDGQDDHDSSYDTDAYTAPNMTFQDNISMAFQHTEAFATGKWNELKDRNIEEKLAKGVGSIVFQAFGALAGGLIGRTPVSAKIGGAIGGILWDKLSENLEPVTMEEAMAAEAGTGQTDGKGGGIWSEEGVLRRDQVPPGVNGYGTPREHKALTGQEGKSIFAVGEKRRRVLTKEAKSQFNVPSRINGKAQLGGR